MANIARAQVILGRRRGGFLLAYGGYTYEKNQTSARKLYWRCSNLSCSVTVHTNVFSVELGANVVVLKEPTQHQHQPADDVIARQEMIAVMSNVIDADPCAPIRSAYDSAVANVRYPSNYIPTFQSVRYRLRRRRASAFPPVPTTIQDVAITGEWSRTWHDKNFLTHIDNGWGVAIFATDKSLRILASCSTIFVDGTFRSAPSPYYQLVTIHGLYREAVIPLCFCLSTGKSLAQYRHILHEICVKIRGVTRRRWRPDTAICDFELALILALETELRGIRVRGCYFHFSQSLWRKFASLGLVSEYRAQTDNGRRLREFVRKTRAIGFLPAVIISTKFHAYCASPRVLRLCATFPRLREYINYIQHVYIGQTASFRPPMWCVYDRDMDVRTNNFVERYSIWNIAYALVVSITFYPLAQCIILLVMALIISLYYFTVTGALGSNYPQASFSLYLLNCYRFNDVIS